MNSRRKKIVNILVLIIKWAAAFPNGRLAVLGVALMFLVYGVLLGFGVMGKLLFDYLTEPVRKPNWEFYWNAYLTGMWYVSIIMIVPGIAGMTMIPFAGYRAVRDYLARRRNA